MPEGYARPSLYLAADYADRGDKESALTWLARAFEDHDAQLNLLGVTEFDPLRSDPRFQRLIRAMELSQ
jgi:hypothetical protein